MLDTSGFHFSIPTSSGVGDVKNNPSKASTAYDQRQGLYSQRGLSGSMPSVLNTSTNNNRARVQDFQSLSVLNVNVASTRDDNGNRFNPSGRLIYAPDTQAQMTQISTTSQSNLGYRRAPIDYSDSFNHLPNTQSKRDHHPHENRNYYHLPENVQSNFCYIYITFVRIKKTFYGFLS